MAPPFFVASCVGIVMAHPSEQNSQTSFKDDKAWELKDDFEYAPKLPAGDSWKVLLDALVKKEKQRCDAWNNEIQTLLIFAGLVSGLATTFITLSYKRLEPDPNADIVNLLAIIAESLNNSTSTLARAVSIANEPSSSFSPSSAAILVNVCWFLSLVLSLAVILSGIVVMQWLREHQSFTGQSSRDMIAIFNMRIEALDKWHVRGIITSFPIILAFALVLFFVGMVEFLHMLGNRIVMDAVVAVISIVLVLLFLTTILPSFQSIFLYSRILPQKPPSPCPYKSPQSGLFHAVCYYTSYFLARRFKGVNVISRLLRSLSALNTENQHALDYLSNTWSKKTWAEIDLCWLSVRQACVCSKMDGYHTFLSGYALPPLFDISKTFRDIVYGVKVPPDILVAAYHCFHDLSTPFTLRNYPQRKRFVERSELDSTFKFIVRRNQLLRSLMRPHGTNTEYNLTSNINFGEVKLRMEFHSYISILHHQNMFMFTDMLSNCHYANDFYHHRVELGIRLANAFYSRWYHVEHDLEAPFPPYLKGDLFDQLRFRILKNDISGMVLSVPIFQQYSHVLETFFCSAADSYYSVSSNCLLAHRDTGEFLEKAAWTTFIIMTTLNLAKYSEQDHAKAIKIFQNIMTQISSSLTTSESTRDCQPVNPIYNLYLTAIYVRRLNSLRLQLGACIDETALNALEATMLVMLAYKSNTLDRDDTGGSHALEFQHRLNGKDRFGSVQRFSAPWWSFLEGTHDRHCKDSEASPFTRLWWKERRPALIAPAVPSTPAIAVLQPNNSLSPTSMYLPRSHDIQPLISTAIQGSLPSYSENHVALRVDSSMAASSSTPIYIDTGAAENIQSLEVGRSLDSSINGSSHTASPKQQASTTRMNFSQSLNVSTSSKDRRPLNQPSTMSSLSSLKDDKIEMVEIVPPSAETTNPASESITRAEASVNGAQYPDLIYNPDSLSDNPYLSGD